MPEPPPSAAHAVLVGIDAYQRARPLPPTTDAEDLAALLTDPAYAGYPPENVALLRNEAANAAAIRAALARLATTVPAEGSALIYFSGHGGRVATATGPVDHLLPVEADPSSPAALAATAIPGPELVALVAAIPAARVLLILDCCHAAGLGATRDLVPDLPLTLGLSEALYDALRSGRGRVVLAASRAEEASYVLPGARNGLFTTHLLAGLRGGVASEDGTVRVFDLFEYLQPRVTAERPDQHPVFKAELESNFAIARYRGGARGQVPRDAEGFRYDAYLSYVDREPDSAWVWGTLMPRLEAAGLRLVVSGESEAPGVARVVNMERGVSQAKRTVALLSPAYLADPAAGFEALLGQTEGLDRGEYRLLPMIIQALDPAALPLRIRMLSLLDATHPRRGPQAIDRLIAALAGPLPRG